MPGADVERRRRVESSAVGTSIGVPKEPRGEVWGGVSPPHRGRGLNFSILELK